MKCFLFLSWIDMKTVYCWQMKKSSHGLSISKMRNFFLIGQIVINIFLCATICICVCAALERIFPISVKICGPFMGGLTVPMRANSTLNVYKKNPKMLVKKFTNSWISSCKYIFPRWGQNTITDNNRNNNNKIQKLPKTQQEVAWFSEYNSECTCDEIKFSWKKQKNNSTKQRSSIKKA